VYLHDISPLAQGWAETRIRTQAPDVRVHSWDGVTPPADGALLLVSHVLNELPESATNKLTALARRFSRSLWVESGNHDDSNALVAMRERLRDLFTPLAPCPHSGACGLLASGNAHHWCHFFSQVPSEVFQDRRWKMISEALQVDLRSMPFSYLYLERAAPRPATTGNETRVIGYPREYKGYMKALSCRVEGAREIMIQRRDHLELSKKIQKRKSGTWFQWEVEKDRLTRSLDETAES
jgi:ribosomal protein RSM22 (predicted rRNA methylase)